MTIKELKEIIKNNHISDDVKILSDTGWEFNSVNINVIYYNKDVKEMILCQFEDEFYKKLNYKTLYNFYKKIKQ